MERRAGIVRTELQIKAFILFILRHFTVPLPLEMLTDLAIDRVPDYFEYICAVNDLLARDMIEEAGPGRNFRITETGRKMLEPVEKSLPYAIRMHTEEAIRSAAQRLYRETAITASIERDGGMFCTKLGLNADHGKAMSLELFFSNKEQAEEIASNFKKYGERIFAAIMADVSRDYGEK